MSGLKKNIRSKSKSLVACLTRAGLSLCVRVWGLVSG